MPLYTAADLQLRTIISSSSRSYLLCVFCGASIGGGGSSIAEDGRLAAVGELPGLDAPVILSVVVVVLAAAAAGEVAALDASVAVPVVVASAAFLPQLASSNIEIHKTNRIIAILLLSRAVESWALALITAAVGRRSTHLVLTSMKTASMLPIPATLAPAPRTSGLPTGYHGAHRVSPSGACARVCPSGWPAAKAAEVEVARLPVNDPASLPLTSIPPVRLPS